MFLIYLYKYVIKNVAPNETDMPKWGFTGWLSDDLLYLQCSCVKCELHRKMFHSGAIIQ